MATANEQRSSQATYYYTLLSLKAQNPSVEIKGLREAIGAAKAAMLEPEIAWVEKQIAEVYK